MSQAASAFSCGAGVAISWLLLPGFTSSWGLGESGTSGTQQGVIASGCLATDHVSNMIPSFSRHCSFFLELKKNSAGHLRSPLRSLQRNCQSIVTTAMFSLDQSSKWRVIFSIISKCKKNYIPMATGTSSFGFLTEQKVFWKAMKMSPPSQIIP